MDAVYVLGNGSQANNLELLCSINLLRKNCLDLRNIYVVGNNPGFVGDFEVLAANDDYKFPWQNVYAKIKLAIKELDLSDKFILMNDDFFANEEFMAADLPYYAVKNGNGGINGINDFGIHAPYIIEKELFNTLPLNIVAPKDISIRSFYSNFFRCPPTFVKDVIVREGENMPSFDEQVQGQPWFSTDDHIFTLPEFQNWIKNKCGIIEENNQDENHESNI